MVATLCFCCHKNIFVPWSCNGEEGLDNGWILASVSTMKRSHQLSCQSWLGCWNWADMPQYRLFDPQTQLPWIFLSIYSCNPPVVRWFHWICQLLWVHPKQRSTFVSVSVPLFFSQNNNMNFMQMFLWVAYQNLFTFIKLESKHKKAEQCSENA